MKSRAELIEWWFRLSSEIQYKHWVKFREQHFTVSQSPTGLTGREIEIIYTQNKYNNMMILISSPYSHSDVTIKMERVKRLALFVDAQIKNGRFVFSPILYGISILKHTGDKDDWATWQVFCENAILASTEVWVLMFDGWDKSTGVKAEIDFAIANNIPIKYIEMID